MDQHKNRDEDRDLAKELFDGCPADAEERLRNLTATEVKERMDEKAGIKWDGGKAPLRTHLLEYFPKALMCVALISEYGSRKYTTGGWKTVENAAERYGDAGLRHATLQAIEGSYDDNDSGLPHAGQEAWNALARLEKLIEGGLEVRVGNDIEVVDGKPVPVLGTHKVVKV